MAKEQKNKSLVGVITARGIADNRESKREKVDRDPADPEYKLRCQREIEAYRQEQHELEVLLPKNKPISEHMSDEDLVRELDLIVSRYGGIPVTELNIGAIQAQITDLLNKATDGRIPIDVRVWCNGGELFVETSNEITRRIFHRLGHEELTSLATQGERQ